MLDAAVADLPEGSPPQGLMQDVMAEVEAVVAEVTAEVGGAARRYCRPLQSSMTELRSVELATKLWQDTEAAWQNLVSGLAGRYGSMPYIAT